MSEVHPIEPVFDDKSTILILGSFPSVKSREVGFYYGHPSNRFWKVLDRLWPGNDEKNADMISEDETAGLGKADIETKINFLRRHKIAVWDVIHSCSIVGSSDASISDVVSNDLSIILDNSLVKTIYINGKKAYELYYKYIYPQLHVKYGRIANAVLLPSTSPANATYSLDALVNAWKRIRIGTDMTFDGAPYTMNRYCRDFYGEKLYKLSLDGGFTCPNRDGTLGTRGCIFCDGDGSGAFAGTVERIGNGIRNCSEKDIQNQLESQKKLISGKTSNIADTNIEVNEEKVFGSKGYIAYFQAYTGTYDSVERLRRLYLEAVSDPEVKIISIATRPDCIDADILALLSEINAIKPVWIELGLQTIHKQSVKYIRRGYDNKIYEKAVAELQKIGISQIITHVILGLPGEKKSDMAETVSYVARSGSNGIKLQLLHVLEGTDLALDYKAGNFETLTLEEYTDILKACIDALPNDLVIHRLTGDGDKKKLIAPMWSADKKRVLNTINKALGMHT